MSHRTNPSQAPTHVDHFLGSSFDIVYAVYKELGNFPILVNFATNYMVVLDDIVPKLENFNLVQYPTLLQKAQETAQWGETVELQHEAVVGLAQQVEGHKLVCEDIANSLPTTLQTFYTTVENTFVPKIRSISTGSGLQGGGDLTSSRELSVVFGTAENTVAQGNDSRIVNAVPKTRRIETGYGLTGEGSLESDLTLSVKVGTTADTLAAGNDSRIIKGEAAYGWGNHAAAGYATTDTTYSSGVGLDLSGTTFSVKFGTGNTDVMAGNDSRVVTLLSDVSALQSTVATLQSANIVLQQQNADLMQRVTALENL